MVKRSMPNVILLCKILFVALGTSVALIVSTFKTVA